MLKRAMKTDLNISVHTYSFNKLNEPATELQKCKPIMIATLLFTLKYIKLHANNPESYGVAIRDCASAANFSKMLATGSTNALLVLHSCLLSI